MPQRQQNWSRAATGFPHCVQNGMLLLNTLRNRALFRKLPPPDMQKLGLCTQTASAMIRAHGLHSSTSSGNQMLPHPKPDPRRKVSLQRNQRLEAVKQSNISLEFCIKVRKLDS
jgi:hypothetical protein